MATPAALPAAAPVLGYGVRPPAPALGAQAAKAKSAAQEFEAVFLTSMFNEMFASMRGDGPLGGAGTTGIWRSFLAEEYAKSFAQAGGLGIGDQVYKTLLEIQEGARR